MTRLSSEAYSKVVKSSIVSWPQASCRFWSNVICNVMTMSFSASVAIPVVHTVISRLESSPTIRMDSRSPTAKTCPKRLKSRSYSPCTTGGPRARESSRLSVCALRRAFLSFRFSLISSNSSVPPYKWISWAGCNWVHEDNQHGTLTRSHRHMTERRALPRRTLLARGRCSVRSGQ